MKRDEYPVQEPLSEAGQAYADECWRRGADVECSEHAFGPDPYQRLLVSRAKHPDGRVLLFWHGGGWTSGYKEWMTFMAPAFCDAGVTFVSAGYRLAPQHVFPTGLEDCAIAVKWVAEHIAAFGADPSRIFVGGHSAGGHYAALLSVDSTWTRKLALPADAVRGCLALSGVYEFGEGSGLSARPRFLGADTGNDARASPRLHVTSSMPPFLIAYGTRDFPHLVDQAVRFAQAVREAGGDVETVVLDDRTHFTVSYAGGERQGPWVPAALSFMQRHAVARPGRAHEGPR